MLRLFLLLYVPSLLLGQQWNAQNYPNPTAGQFRECKMKTHARICDPDGVLDEGSRSRLDYELQQLERRTEQQYARTFCEKKGITAAMAVAKRVQGGSTQAVEDMANNMLKTWILDQQCQKSIVIVVATDDAKFWVARDDKVPVYANEFTGLFMKQKETFKRKQYVEALQGLIQGTWELALSKQDTPRQQPAPGPRPTAPQPGYGEGGRSTGPGMKMPSIPGWVWIVLIFVVIPTLLCCCCIYCCCCRGKGGGGGGGRQPLPQDIPAGGGGSGGGGGGGRGPFGNFLSTLSGAGVGSMIGNFLSNRNRGGAGAGSMGMGGMGGGGYSGGGEYQGGGAHPAPPQPTYDDNDGQGGGGLYPSVAVKDRGGGGSWE